MSYLTHFLQSERHTDGMMDGQSKCMFLFRTNIPSQTLITNTKNASNGIVSTFFDNSTESIKDACYVYSSSMRGYSGDPISTFEQLSSKTTQICFFHWFL